MDIINLSNKAVEYYNSLKKKNLPAGWEKYVATNGESCLFVKSDYVPRKDEAVFYLMTRNFQTSCQLYKRGDDLPDADATDEPGPRFTIEPLDKDLMWQVVDHEHGVKMAFREGLVNETQEVATPNDLSQTDIFNVPKWLREMGEWIGVNHADEALCNTEARAMAINAINKEGYWITLAAALNGTMTADTTQDSPVPQNKLLYNEIEDYLAAYDVPWLDEEGQAELLDILDNHIDEDGANEVCKIIRAYWESNRNPNDWAREILWWPAFVPSKDEEKK